MPWTNNNDNTALYAEPTNGGIGFGNWSSSKSSSLNSGYNLGNSTDGGGGDVNVGLYNNAFQVYGHSSTFAIAIRPIADVLSEVGDYLTFNFNINFRNGAKGIRFRNSLNSEIYVFQAAGDKYEDYTTGTGYTDLLWPYVSNGVYTLQASRGASDTTITVLRTVESRSQTRTISESIASIEFFCANTDNSSSSNNLYFNSLSTFNPYRT